MRRHAGRSAIANIFGFLGSAVSVAAAAENGRKPRARDLQTLGIDPQQFRGIRG
ncbi:MAG: hypothetical protein INR68_01820 [Methylobacterium mesophilicum]|nr:hypothetical protein [Methylobacterium mesophilicum]